jgi:hypothetical protein
MIFETFVYISYTLFCFFSVLGYGIIFSKIFFPTINKNIGELGFFGFLTFFFISLFFHFFFPLSFWFNFFVLLLGLIICLINFYYIKSQIYEFRKYILLITLIILPSVLIYQTHADYEWYHLPYVNYLNNFKVIFGLVNVSNSYTYGHGWMDIMGLFSIPVVENKGLSILALIFFYFYLIYLIIDIKKTEFKSVKVFSILLIVYSFANFNKLTDFGAEIQPSLILFVLLLNILKSLHNRNSIELLALIILYFSFAITLRIGSIIILPLLLVIILLNYKNIPKYVFKFTRLNCFLLLFLICFLIKNFIVTGCLSYPIYQTCFENTKISWASPIENVKERFELLSAKSKRWIFYYIE